MTTLMSVLVSAGASEASGPVARTFSLDDAVRAARADAARRAGVDAAAVRVVRAEAVTWRDGSLGCPQPDRAYTQALVPGWRVLIEAGSQVHYYHAGRGGAWYWCPPGQSVEPLPAGEGT